MTRNQFPQFSIAQNRNGHRRHGAHVLHVFDMIRRNGPQTGVRHANAAVPLIPRSGTGTLFASGICRGKLIRYSSRAWRGMSPGRKVETLAGGHQVILILGNNGSIPVEVEFVNQNPVDTH